MGNTFKFKNSFPLLWVRPELLIFILSLGVSSFFFQEAQWNQNSRFDLVRSMVELKTFKIDKFHENTGDKYKRGDHYYSDKAPGTSWLAALPYYIIHKMAGDFSKDPKFLKFSLGVSTVFAVGIPSSFALVAIFYFLRMMMLSAGISACLTLAYGFGTLTFPYSTMFYGHQLSAALLIISFALLFRIKHIKSFSRRQLLGIGFLLGFSFITDYSSILGIIPLLVYAGIILRWSLKPIMLGSAGFFLPVLFLLYYNWSVFGGILNFSYQFSVIPEIHQGVFLGLGSPHLDRIFYLLFSGYRGLFFSSPWLLLGIPGMCLLVQKKGYRAEGMICLTIFILFVWFNASFEGWHGGSAFGARYLIPSIPFLAVAAGAFWLPYHGRTVLLNNDHTISESNTKKNQTIKTYKSLSINLAFTLAAIYSIFMMFVATAVNPQVPVFNLSPYSYLIPTFFSGKLMGNMGELLGLKGLLTVIPLVLFLGIISFWLFKVVRQSQSEFAFLNGDMH